MKARIRSRRSSTDVELPRLSNRRTRCRRHTFPSRHVEVGNPTQRPLAEVCILGALDEAWLHGQGGRGTLQSLYPGLFISAYDTMTLAV